MKSEPVIRVAEPRALPRSSTEAAKFYRDPMERRDGRPVPTTPMRRPLSSPSLHHFRMAHISTQAGDTKASRVAGVGELRGPPSAALRRAARRQPPRSPALPPAIRQWGSGHPGGIMARSLEGYRPARTIESYTPWLRASHLDEQWRAAHAALHGNWQPTRPPCGAGSIAVDASLPLPARLVLDAVSDAGGISIRVRLADDAPPVERPQLCTPTAIIARHLQSTLHTGFAGSRRAPYELRGPMLRARPAPA